ncbi:hypothetical protein JCM10213_003479 [Rhodosporidiobolus nylandii]
MAELSMLLPQLFPGEDVALSLEALRSFGINTATDLVFTSSIPPDPALSPTSFTSLKRAVSAHLSAPSSSGAYLHVAHSGQAQTAPQGISTSLEELDGYLAGGLALGDVVEITGPRGSGRTALAMYVTLLHLLLHADKRAAWLDTSGGFDAHRCLAILRDVLIPRLQDMGGSFAGEDGLEPKAEELAISVLDRLAVTRVGKSGDALDILGAETKQKGKDETLDFVVIDALDVLVGGEALAGTSAQGHANLVAFLRRLSSLAHSTTLPLVVLAITTVTLSAPPASSRPTAPPQQPLQPPPLSSLPLPAPLKPSLGSISSYLFDLSLLLLPAQPLFGKVDGRDRYLLEVTRNARGRTGVLCAFKLENGVTLEELLE